MNQFLENIGQKIARAARAFERRRTNRGRKWVAVFINEDTIKIALLGSLTRAERELAQSPIGAVQVRQFHQQLFTHVSATLLQRIERITGMRVRNTTVEIEPTTGRVVQLFTTDTVGEEFPLTASESIRTRRERPLRNQKTGCFIRV